VSWDQPNERSRISSIYVKGVVKNGAEDFASFDAPCKRAGSAWLGDASWKFGTFTITDLVCYVKLDGSLKPTTPDGKIQWPEADAQIANMRVQYTAKIKSVNKPMRYVTWINEQVAAVKEAISAPFQRN
jgi:hypothetical protein